MTKDDLATILRPVQEDGIAAISTAAAVLVAQTLSGYRRLGRDVQEDVLRQVIAEAWRLHDVGCSVAQAETGLPMGLRPLDRRMVN